MADDYRCVFVANGEIEARQVASFLEGSGIATTTRSESLQHLYGLSLDGLGRVEVLVQAADEGQALELLASAEAGELRISD
ncbi:MAG TPA: DUF2007 domain-containing protein [Vicinamibacterales bacterium]|nr:DUF2007 domain-containing protein [Vicinamibacterales bacterium]